MPREIFQILDILFQALYFALMIRVLLSWIPHDPEHPIISFIYRVTEPILSPFRDLIPSHKIGIDISPIFAFIALSVVQSLLYRLL